LLLAALVAVAACSRQGADQHAHPTDLVTRTSLGGIHLQDSRATVERLYGPGRNLHRHGERAFHYSAGLTVSYDAEAKGAPVALVEATSPRFHTASGARLGGSARAVRALGHMDCGVVSKATAFSDREVDCVTRAHGPGLMFDIVAGRVVYLALVLRTD
jgi:hypothetical protein